MMNEAPSPWAALFVVCFGPVLSWMTYGWVAIQVLALSMFGGLVAVALATLLMASQRQ
jgi:hypothetical protein